MRCERKIFLILNLLLSLSLETSTMTLMASSLLSPYCKIALRVSVGDYSMIAPFGSW